MLNIILHITGLYAEVLQMGGGGRTWGILKRGGRAQLQAASGGSLEDNVLPHSTKTNLKNLN